MSGDLTLGQSREPRAAVTDAMKVKGLISELNSVTLLNSSLSSEEGLVTSMSRGLEAVLKMKKPGTAACFLHRQL